MGNSAAQRWRPLLWAAIATILLIPAVAMKFGDTVQWDASDFAYAAVLLIGAAAIFEIVAWRTRRLAYRAVAGVALTLGVLVIWADAAVGIL